MPVLNARGISQELLNNLNHACRVRVISQGELLHRLVALHRACMDSPTAPAQELLKEAGLEQVTVVG